MSKSRFWRLAASALAALGLLGMSGCSVGDPVTSDPLTRNLQWFSYVGGDDLREGCSPAAPARYRFVYNAVWEEQVRTYDLQRISVGQGAVLSICVIRGAPRLLQSYIVDSPQVGSSRVDVRLSEAAYLDLIRAAEADGFGRPVADNTRLESHDFYWLANACAAGSWHLHAWRRQDAGFGALGFAERLLRLDTTGVPPNPVREINLAERQIRYGEAASERGRAVNDSFQLIIRDGRLWGHARLF